MKVVFVIIGTIIGAGFASGKEIHLFFGQYGINGIIGIIISSILTGLIIYKVLTYINKNNISTYDKFINNLGNGKENINTIIKIIINLFLLISYYIMVAGFSTYLYEQFNIPIIIGSIILNTLSYIVFKNNTKGIIKANSILIPIAIIIIIILGIKLIDFNLNITQKIITSNNIINSIISSILYSSYNSILLIPILITLKEYASKNKKIKFITITTTTILIILSLIIYFILLKINIDINTIEMPLVYLASKIGILYKYIYGTIILFAIFTTAISAGHGFLSNTAKNKKKYNYLIIFMIISSLIVTKIGFSKLIGSLYPIFGILGLIQIIMILFKNSIEKKE